MSKKMMKRSLALGALMAFVITGSAMAADVTAKYEDGKILDGAGIIIDGYGEVTGAGTLTVKSTGNNAVTINEEGKKLTINADNVILDAYNDNGNAILAYDNLDITAKNNLNMYAGNRVIRVLDNAVVNLEAASIYINTDEDGNKYKLTDNENANDAAAIKVSDGAELNIKATKDVNLYASTSNVGTKMTGIRAEDSETSVNVYGETIDLTVENEYGGRARGVNAIDGAVINVGDVNTDKIDISVIGKGADSNSYGILAQTSGSEINLDAREINISVKNKDGIVSGVSTDYASIDLGSKNTELINIHVEGKNIVNKQNTGIFAGWAEGVGSQINVDGSLLKITGSGGTNVCGIKAQNGTSNGAKKVATVVVGENTKTDIKFVDENNNRFGTGIAAISEGAIDIKGDLSIIALSVIDARGGATVNINADGKDKIVNLTGDISYDYSGATSGTTIDAKVNLHLTNDKSSFTGAIIKSSDVASIPGGKDKVTGMNFELSNGATWNVTGDSFVNTLNGDGGKMELAVLEVENQKRLAKVAIDKNNATNLTVYGDETFTQDIENGEIKQEDALGYIASSIDGANEETKVAIAEGDILGEVTVSVGADGKVVAGSVKEAVNTVNKAIGEASVVGIAHIRAHMNDMNKRMGELRMANGEAGVWARMVRGEEEFAGAKSQYNQYQLGYDEKLSVDKRWTVGAAVTFAEGNGNFANGSTENDSTAFAVYGSKLNNDGSFVDLIARYANFDSDITMGREKADYSTNGYSVSAEFGKRIQQGNGLWIEPQFELTYGSVDSAEYSISGRNVQVGDMDSLIGRVGFSLGKDIKQGNVYARASYLYDFDGETETTFGNGKVTRTIEEDLGGGWFEVGVGTNINLSKATYIYADVEKTFGGEVDTNWKWNLGVRYSF